LPLGPGAMATQARHFLPVLGTVGGAKDGRIFDARIDRVRIAERRLEMPDALEFPWALRAVIPLVGSQRCGRGIVGEFVALAFEHAARILFFAGGSSRLMPGLTAIVGSLDDLTEPAAGLRRVNALGVDRRAFQVVHFPAGEMRPVDFPVIALAVGCE